MLKGQLLGDTFRDVDLTLEAVNAGVSTIGSRHDSTDATTHHGNVQNGFINRLTVDSSGTAWVSLLATNIRFHSILKRFLCLRRVNGWLEKHIVFGGLDFFSLVNFHV